MYDSLRPELLTATETQRRMMRADPVHVVTRERGLGNGWEMVGKLRMRTFLERVGWRV
jgi:hypothetical protein